MTYRVWLALLALLIMAIAQITPARASAQPDPSIEGRIDALISRMTLSEKIGQLHLEIHTDPLEEQADRIRKGMTGGVFNVVERERIAAYKEAARQSRLGIPLLFGVDAINVFRVAFPMPIGWAATWQPELAERAANWVARETAAVGINWTFAPMVDISRDPRWGRVIEGAGEDPMLGAAFSAARVRGYRNGGLATSVKHYVGYGAAEGGRDYANAAIPLSELLDVHLPPFKAAIDAGAETVMASLNAINGVPATASKPLLTDILRGRLKFRGLVVSDYGAINELQSHGVAVDGAQAARRALQAGVDLDMVSGLYRDTLPAEVAAGHVAIAEIDRAVRNILRVKFMMGLFDGKTAPGSPPDPADVRKAAREVATASLVLAKNDNSTLPVNSNHATIALIGAAAGVNSDISWYGPAKLSKPVAETLVDALRRQLTAGQRLAYVEGVADRCGKAAGDLEAAKTAGAQSDLTILVVSEDCEAQGEGTSRATLGLTGANRTLFEAVATSAKRLVLIVETGRPLAIPAETQRADAVLIGWHGGTEGGPALADILLGRANPSGKLPMTFPRAVGQIPIHHAQLPTGRPAANDRFTSRYIDEEVAPLFPFGWGLSYTTFAYGAAKLSAQVLARGEELSLEFPITNVGSRHGIEIAQVYLRQTVGRRSQPMRQLKAFQAVSLTPGETKSVKIRLEPKHFGYHDDAGTFVVEASKYELYIGGSAKAPLAASFEISGDAP